MDSDITKLRNNNESYSVGIPKDMALELLDKKFNRFLITCDEIGVVTLTPMGLLNERVEKIKFEAQL